MVLQRGPADGGPLSILLQESGLFFHDRLSSFTIAFLQPAVTSSARSPVAAAAAPRAAVLPPRLTAPVVAQGMRYALVAAGSLAGAASPVRQKSITLEPGGVTICNSIAMIHPARTGRARRGAGRADRAGGGGSWLTQLHPTNIARFGLCF